MTRPLPGNGGTRRGLAGLALAVALLLSTAAPAGAAPADPADTTFVVVLDESGDAEVTLRLTFDVSTDRRALERLRENRSAVMAEFADGMAAVAAGAESETGRSMSVTEPTMRVDAEAGLVELSVTWRGLAVVEGDHLRVTAPFDEGFRAPGRFVVRAPEGYAVDVADPAPASASGREATWAAGTSLDGFAVTFAPVAGDGPSQPMPGFGASAAVLALALAAAVALLARRGHP